MLYRFGGSTWDKDDISRGSTPGNAFAEGMSCHLWSQGNCAMATRLVRTPYYPEKTIEPHTIPICQSLCTGTVLGPVLALLGLLGFRAMPVLRRPAVVLG